MTSLQLNKHAEQMPVKDNKSNDDSGIENPHPAKRCMKGAHIRYLKI